jgi:hypothetical protein
MIIFGHFSMLIVSLGLDMGTIGGTLLKIWSGDVSSSWSRDEDGA